MIAQQNITTSDVLRLALPKGRMQDGVFRLLADAGIRIQQGSRGYRPSISLPGFEVKILKPQNIVEMLHFGSRDLGFAGADWVAELDGELVEVLDTGLDPVSLVAALPRGKSFRDAGETLLIASEYRNITERWIAKSGLRATCIRSYGATEVFPPEDADGIVDITATGATLQANGLEIAATLLESSTRLYANPRSLDRVEKREEIESLTLLLKSVLDARERVMLELNVTAEAIDRVIRLLPAMREATIATLHGNRGFAVKAAIRRTILPSLIPQLKRSGGTEIIISSPSQIVP